MTRSSGLMGLLALIVLVTPRAGNATIIIDFDDATTGLFTADYFEDGYVMSSEIGHYHIASSSNGTNAVTIDAVGDTDDSIRFALDGGGLFNLLSLDVLETGDEENGGTLTGSNGASLALGAGALGTNTFGASWENLEWIELTISDANEEWATIDNIELQAAPEPVTIDIKPGSDPNSINLKSKGRIPVAILTTDTFLAFNEVDPLSVAFGPDGATESHGRAHIKDVDDDGDMDMVLHFNTQDTGIQCGDTEATLTGMTFGGEPITGTDTIVTVNCPKVDIGHIWRVNYTQPALNSMNSKVETHVLATDSSFASSGANYWNEVLPVPATQTLMETSVAGGGAPSITFVGLATSSTVSAAPMSGEPIDDDLDDWAARFSGNVVDWELRDLNPVASYDLVFYDLDSLTASITLTTEVDSDGDGGLDQTDTIAWDIGDDFSLFQGVQPDAAGVIRGKWTGSSSSFVDVAGFQVAESIN